MIARYIMAMFGTLILFSILGGISRFFVHDESSLWITIIGIGLGLFALGWWVAKKAGPEEKV